MRFRIIIVSSVILLVAMLILVMGKGSGGPRVVARAVLPNGVEMYMLQQPNCRSLVDIRALLDEPWFTTRFVYRSADGVWRSYYYWHEDTYWWRRGRFVVNTNSSMAVLFRGKDALIRLQYDSGLYEIIRPDANGIARTPQSYPPHSVPAGWMPETLRSQK
jgi:hypothetical protein